MPSPWLFSNPACSSTWILLANSLKQIEANFKDAGALTMKDLAYWNPTASSDARRTEAMGLASQLDKMILEFQSTYEKGYTRTTAVGAMTDKLVTETATVADLAAAVDAAYHFFEEGQ